MVALTRALRTSNDGKLAHQILVDIGVVRNVAAEPATLPSDYDQEREVQIMMGRLVQAAAERARVYGTPPEKIGYGLEEIAKSC